jgi:hypothetical protein
LRIGSTRPTINTKRVSKASNPYIKQIDDETKPESIAMRARDRMFASAVRVTISPESLNRYFREFGFLPKFLED